jgi:DNA mismatch repair protein MLH3
MVSISSSSRRPWLQAHPEPGQCTNQSDSFDARLASGQKYNANDVSMSFTKEQLRRAQVIGQVDTKFVACIVDDGIPKGSRTLVLVDQHAADERIRVEQFLSEVCQGFLHHRSSGGVEAWELKPAVPILLTRLEVRTLANSEAYQHAFERWGFRFASMKHAWEDVAEEGTGDEYLQVLVEAVPDVVSEKVMKTSSQFDQMADTKSSCL